MGIHTHTYRKIIKKGIVASCLLPLSLSGAKHMPSLSPGAVTCSVFATFLTLRSCASFSLSLPTSLPPSVFAQNVKILFIGFNGLLIANFNSFYLPCRTSFSSHCVRRPPHLPALSTLSPSRPGPAPFARDCDCDCDYASVCASSSLTPLPFLSLSAHRWCQP